MKSLKSCYYCHSLGWRWAGEPHPHLHACLLFLMLCGSLWSPPAAVPFGRAPDGQWQLLLRPGFSLWSSHTLFLPLPLFLCPPSRQQHPRRPRLPLLPTFYICLVFPTTGCGHLEVGIAQVVPLLGRGPPLADHCLRGQTLLSPGNTIISMGQDGFLPRMGFVFLEVSLHWVIRGPRPSGGHQSHTPLAMGLCSSLPSALICSPSFLSRCEVRSTQLQQLWEIVMWLVTTLSY